MTTPAPETTGQAIKRFRGAMPRHVLAVRAGVNPETIARYERDERSPRVDELREIAAALGVRIYALIPDQDQPARLAG